MRDPSAPRNPPIIRGAVSAGAGSTPASAFLQKKRRQRASRRLTDEQVEFVRLCKQVREKYPSLARLAVLYGVSYPTIYAAAHGLRYRDVPWRKGVL